MSDHTRSALADAVQALALLSLGAFLLVVSFIGPAESEPHTSHQRPATESEIQQRQGDLLMQEMEQARDDR